MKEWFEKIKTRSDLHTLVSLAVGALSLLFLILALQLNFNQQMLYTQVTMVTEDGHQEMMIFRDYRDLESSKALERYDRCRLRNEIFGDGTDEACNGINSQQNCIKKAESQVDITQCLQQ